MGSTLLPMVFARLKDGRIRDWQGHRTGLVVFGNNAYPHIRLEEFVRSVSTLPPADKIACHYPLPI